MHPIRDFSRLRWLLLCSACVVAAASPAQARRLIPEKPSVEVNLNALRALEAPAAYQPAPMPPITYETAPAPQVPAYQPSYAPAPVQRQVPTQQFTPPAPAPKALPKPVAKPVPKPAPKPVTPPPAVKPAAVPAPAQPSPLPPPPAPLAAPAPSPVIAPVAAPVVAPPVALPAITPPPVVAPKPVPVPAPKAETPKPVSVPAPKPVPAPKAETPKPAAAVLPAFNDLPPLPPVNAPVVPPAPKAEAPKPAGLPSLPAAAPVVPKVEAPKPVVPAAPKPAPKAADLPSLPVAPMSTPPGLPPLPTGSVNVPTVEKIRGPEPDISGLNFSNLPGTPKASAPAAPAPAPKAAVPAPVAPAVPAIKPPEGLPLAPVAPTIPTLPPPPKAETGPLLIPVPKPAAPLPPTVSDRLNVLNEQPGKQGIVSDRTTVQDHAGDMAARKKLEAEAKLKAEREAAAAKLKKEQEDSDARLKKAQADIDAKAKLDADAKLKAETELAAAKKNAEEKAKADAEAAKKAALKLPPAALPPPIAMPSIPTIDPLAKSSAPVKLEKSDIAALPSLGNSSVAKPALPVAPVLPKAPTTAPSNPNLPQLPTLTIPGAQPNKPLPSLTAITGGDAPSSMDILQPRDGVESSPLDVLGAPSMPTNDDLLTVKRELPEVNVGAAAPKTTGLPVVKSEKKPAAPALPSIPSIPAPISTPPGLPPLATGSVNVPPVSTITPKTDEKVMVASAPAVSTSGSLETSVKFGAGSSALGDSEKSALSAIADKARKGNKKVRIVGYAAGDADASAVARKTAFARANIIRAFLLSKGMSDAMIHAQALGNQVSADKADIFLQ